MRSRGVRGRLAGCFSLDHLKVVVDTTVYWNFIGVSDHGRYGSGYQFRFDVSEKLIWMICLQLLRIFRISKR